MSTEPTHDPAAAPEAPPAEDAPKPMTEPDAPHGDPLTGDEPGTRHGVTPDREEAAEAASAGASAAASPGAGGADAPPVGAPPAGGDAVAAAEARAAEYLDLAQRKQAEFENFRRRMTTQVAQAEDRGISRLAKELLPALDHLDRALQTAEQHAGAEEWVKGIRLVQDEVTGALSRVGIETFTPVGEPFDPNEHEAVAQAPMEGFEPGSVAQVYQAGYRLNGTILRPARVIVAQ